MDREEEIVRLLALDIRLRSENQAEAIRALHSAGFGPGRIAELLGTTPGTVNVTIARVKRREGKQTNERKS